MVDDEVLDELKQIGLQVNELRRYVRFLAMFAITASIDKVATTPERQQIWRLADGTRSNDEIANQIGVALRTVQYFVQEAENAGLIISERRGYPKKIEEIIPKEWKPWKQVREKTQPASSETTSAEIKDNAKD